MQLNKLAITLLGATAVAAATLPIGKRDAELVGRFDSDVVVKRAPLLSERQGTGGNSGQNCGHDGSQHFGPNSVCNDS